MNLCPFRSTGAIRDPDQFFDRERELRIVLQALEKGQSVQVYGPRRRGKTSLLFAVERAWRGRQSQADAGAIAYFTLETARDAENFFRQVAERFELPDLAADRDGLGLELGKRRAVLLLDELDWAIANPEAFPDDFFATLRGWEISHEVRFVIAAKERLPSAYARLLDAPTSPFGNTLLPVELKPFDEETTRELLARLKAPDSWPSDWMVRVYQDSHGGEPWLLQRFGELAWEALESGEKNFEAILKRFREERAQEASPTQGRGPTKGLTVSEVQTSEEAASSARYGTLLLILVTLGSMLEVWAIFGENFTAALLGVLCFAVAFLVAVVPLIRRESS